MSVDHQRATKEFVRVCRPGGMMLTAEVRSGPFEMMTARGFIEDEGLLNAVAWIVRGLSDSCLRNMAWLMPRISRAVSSYLGHILVRGLKPAAG